MEGTDARSLKHEIRTPINHLVGYSALLLESAQDAGAGSCIAQAKELHGFANELARSVEAVLMSVTGHLEPESTALLGAQLMPVIQSFLEHLKTQQAIERLPLSRDDFAKIRAAGLRLQAIAAGCTAQVIRQGETYNSFPVAQTV